MTPTERDAVIAAINWIGETCATYEWELPKCHRRLTSVMAASADQSDAGRDAVIEEMAKAMCEHEAGFRDTSGLVRWRWDTVNDEVRNYWRGKARAVNALTIDSRALKSALASAPSETVGRGESGDYDHRTVGKANFFGTPDGRPR